MIGAAVRWAAVPLLAGFLLMGCRAVPKQPVATDPPGPHEVRQAVSRLSDTVLKDVAVEGWPEHIARSRDFPDLPLVTLDRVEDRGVWGVDTKILRRTIEQTVRSQRALRLQDDEHAVPPSLREEEEDERPVWSKAGRPLRLQSWAGPDGMFHVVLVDPVGDKVVARGKSNVAGRH